MAELFLFAALLLANTITATGVIMPIKIMSTENHSSRRNQPAVDSFVDLNVAKL